MGMDYSYAGSASYPRFNEELYAVAKVLGGTKERCEATGKLKFVFPDGTNEILVRWFNNIYGEDFTEEETKIIWECIKNYPEIVEISYQIWYELKTLVDYNEAWYIS